jgi:hypothetical protein
MLVPVVRALEPCEEEAFEEWWWRVIGGRELGKGQGNSVLTDDAFSRVIRHD